MKAYLAMTNHYAWWMMLPHDKFQRIIEPGNQVAILLATHWIALKQVMAVITETEDKAAEKMPGAGCHDRGRGGAGNGGSGSAGAAGNDISLGIIRWLKYLNRMLDGE